MPARPRWARRRASWSGIEACLDAFLARFPTQERLGADPVQLAHGLPARDAEVAGLVASSLAFGNAKALVAKARAALQPLGAPAEACLAIASAPGRVPEHLRGWTHRWVRGADLAWLLGAVGATLRRHGSLEVAFMRGLGTGPDLLPAMRAFVLELHDAARASGWGDASTRGRRSLLPVPGASASKRLCLYLRWMVRTDGVDRGLWRGVDPARLTIPLDVHVARIGAYLGLTDRSTPGWRMAREITENLARFDPADPTRFDFALSHLGIMGACPRRRDPRQCAACDLVSACRL